MLIYNKHIIIQQTLTIVNMFLGRYLHMVYGKENSYFFRIATEPRELIPFLGGDGTLYECINKFVHNKAKQYSIDKDMLMVKCSYISQKKEDFFNEILFDLLFDEEYMSGNKILIILEDFVKIFKFEMNELIEILIGLTHMNISIEPKEKDLFMSRNTFFPGSSYDSIYDFDTNKYDSEKHFFKLEINPEFLKACMEIRKIK